MGQSKENPIQDIQKLISEFNIQVNAFQEIGFSSLSSSQHVFRLQSKRLIDSQYRGIHFPKDTFVVANSAIRNIACFPHLVGKALIPECQKAADLSVQVIKQLHSNRSNRSPFLIYDVLRAAPGYRIAEAFTAQGIAVPHIQIRPHYRVVSYRDHLGSTRVMEVLWKDFKSLSLSPEWTVIKPDTEASGLTSKVAIERLMAEATKRKVKIKEIICLGFISASSINILESLAEKYKFKLTIIAWGNITALYQNHYDMPVYGLDESAWREDKQIKKLGAIIPLLVLKDYLPYYIPGADQPGDWSARQSMVPTGQGWEKGGILHHLQNSKKFITNLYILSQKQSWFRPWQKNIITKELQKLTEEIKRPLP